MTLLNTKQPLDSVALGVMWTRLESIAEEGNLTIVRTSLSPIVTESKDSSCVIVNANGDLLVGGGLIEFHYGAAATSVRSVLQAFGSDINDGDVFFGNDTYAGVAIHPSDVVVMRPVFHDGVLAAWIVNSAHMVDLGGMVFGSYAPDATECYQESIRFPPVRLSAVGVEQRDVWAIIRNNIRLPDLIEADLRALSAGCFVAAQKLQELIRAGGGVAAFHRSANDMYDLVAREFGRRVRRIESGRYEYTTGTDWEPEYFPVPCRLTLENGRLVFDFEGSAPQAQHFFNTRPYVVAAVLVPHIRNILAHDLPLNQAIYDAVELRCPEGTIVNALKPSPNAFANGDAAHCAMNAGVGCLQLAIAASDDPPTEISSYGEMCYSVFSNWSFSRDGQIDGGAIIDGITMGGPGRASADGVDGCQSALGLHNIIETIEVEVFESWYPILLEERRVRPDVGGAGRRRGGAGLYSRFRPYGVERITGTILGQSQNRPALGMSGGMPGDRIGIEINRGDGLVEDISAHAVNVVLTPKDTVTFLVANGGGIGDPLDRDPQLVADDVAAHRLFAAQAAEVYGVVVDGGVVDAAATGNCRADILKNRLARAEPAAKPIPDTAIDQGKEHALYPGVVQRGGMAFSVRTGAPLARAPDHWTDGCPVMTTRQPTRLKYGASIKAYLDPRSGNTLYVDYVFDGASRTIGVWPDRWTRHAN